MIDSKLLVEHGISEQDLKATPPSVIGFLVFLLSKISTLEKRIEELEARLNKDSSNSHKPPSTDKRSRQKSQNTQAGKAGAKMGHKGYRQEMLTPTESRQIMPGVCRCCGSSTIEDLSPYYTHQVIELPEISLEVLHLILYRGVCADCQSVNKAVVPLEHRSGYGPRMSAMIAQMAGSQGESRTTVQDFCCSVLGLHISLGAIQKVIDRVSRAIEPHYEEIGSCARSQEINHIDETSWRRRGALSWLWVMGSSAAVLFMVHPNRSRGAFQSLIRDWQGVLVSDGYGIYRKWVGLRQTCLAHLIREARGLSQRRDKQTAAFGSWAMRELQTLCHMAHEEPTLGQWRAFYARLIRLITRNRDRKDDAGRFARRLNEELDCLWLFLIKEGVAPTNNFAERMLRYAVLWRKRSLGTNSERGDQWVERILSLRQTCRLRSRSIYHTLVDAVRASFHGENPDLSWIAQL